MKKSKKIEKDEKSEQLKALCFVARPTTQESDDELVSIAENLVQHHPKVGDDFLTEITKLKYSIGHVEWQRPIRNAMMLCSDIRIEERIVQGVTLAPGELLLHLTNNFMVCAFESFVNMLPSIMESDMDGKGNRKLGMAFKLDFGNAIVQSKASVGTKTSFETSGKTKVIPAQKEMDFQSKGDNEKTKEN